MSYNDTLQTLTKSVSPLEQSSSHQVSRLVNRLLDDSFSAWMRASSCQHEHWDFHGDTITHEKQPLVAMYTRYIVNVGKVGRKRRCLAQSRRVYPWLSLVFCEELAKSQCLSCHAQRQCPPDALPRPRGGSVGLATELALRNVLSRSKYVIHQNHPNIHTPRTEA